MSSLLGTGFKYETQMVLPSGEIILFDDTNLLPDVSVDFIAGLIRGDGTAPISSWYVGIFEANYVPTSGVTAADLPGVVGQCSAYSLATRPVWTHAYDGTSVITNSASRAEFTMTAAKTIYGAFLISSNVKTGNSGTLLSIARFSSPKVLDIGTVFGVTASLTLIPTTA
jgi:hypothetical protein